MKAYEISELIGAHGDIKLSDLMLKILGDRKHICPECKGKGGKKKAVDVYPRGLPDSGWVNDFAYKEIPCELCEGHGYTVKEYVPKMVQQGWTTK